MRSSISTRLHANQTHSSQARTLQRSAGFASSDDHLRCLGKTLDNLDHILNSHYNHSRDLFVDKSNVYVQRNPVMSQKGLCHRFEASMKDVDEPRNSSHTNQDVRTLIVGGIKNKMSEHSIQLINVGQHTPLTNPGYSRQTSDGNVFNY